VDIPTDIFQPLLKIAQLGYDANDIRHYYLTMLRHLRRMGAENAEAAYTLVTPNSDRKLPFSTSEDDSSSARPTVESYEDHVSPKTCPTSWSWSRSASYEPSIQEQGDLVASSAPSELFDLSPEQFQQPQLQIPEPTPTQQSFDRALQDRRQTVLMMSANYSPSSGSRPQLDVNEINMTRAEPVSFPGPPTAQASQWFGPEHFQPQPQPQFIHPWPSMHGQAAYQVAMSNTQMPLLVPYPQAPPPPIPQRSFTESFADEFINPFQAGGLSQLATELYHSPFFPTIDVIPSRNKRRKVLKTGVRRIAQGLGNAGAARQASV
jgi:hypothetical protein